MMIGNTSSTRIENGSRRASRNSCATITPSRRSEIMPPARRRVVVALPGDRGEHRFEASGRTISIARSVAASAPSAAARRAAVPPGSSVGIVTVESVDDAHRQTRARREPRP